MAGPVEKITVLLCLITLRRRSAIPGSSSRRYTRPGRHAGRGGVGRAARGVAELGAGCEGQGYEQPRTVSLSASARRCSYHARSLSRSFATTSAGARATKSWLVSLAASAASWPSSRVTSPDRRLHSCCTSIAPSRATNTSLPSPKTAYATGPFMPPSNVSSATCARRLIVSLSASKKLRRSRPRGLMLARRRVLGGTLYSTRMIRIFSTACFTRRNAASRSESTSSGWNVGALELIDRLHPLRQLRQDEAPDVPQLVREVAARRERGFEVVRVEDDVGAERAAADHGPAQRVRTVELHHVDRVDAVAQRFGHLTVLRIAHRAVQVDGRERLPLHEVEAGHDHPRHPEKQDFGRGDERVPRVEARQVRRPLGPAEGRERPQPRGEPRVQHVGVLRHRPAALGAAGRVLAVGPLMPARRAAEHGDAVPPPELARDVPVPDVLHPVLVGRAPALRDEPDLAAAVSGERGLGERPHLHEPLVAEPRLHHRVAAVAVAHRMLVRLALLEQPLGLEQLHDLRSRLEAIEPLEGRGDPSPFPCPRLFTH